MRSRKLILGAAITIIVGLPAQVMAAWSPAAFPKEGKRTAQGCAAKYTDESYMCVFVRCDGRDRLGLYITAPGPDVRGVVQVAIDGSPYAVNIIATPNSPLPLSNRADVFPDALRAAMKTGKILKIVGANLSPGYDIVSLKGAGPLISRIEKECQSMK